MWAFACTVRLLRVAGVQRASYRIAILFCLATGSIPLAAQSQDNNQAPDGFVALFNGRDIDGWRGTGKQDPQSNESSSANDQKAPRTAIASEVARHWQVEDGALVGDGQQQSVVTMAEYGDFELWADWQIGTGGDSGICLRGVPKVQLCDYTCEAASNRGWDKGSGGLCNNKIHTLLPSQIADAPVGQWNRMFIRIVGPYVTVKLNGKTVVEDQVLENSLDRTRPVPMHGPIGLQSCGGKIRFRNLFVRELPTTESQQQIAKMRSDEGFQSKFNGYNLADWMGAVGDYQVVDGAIVCRSGREGTLITKEIYSNFIARLEFKLPPGGNNGLAIHTPSAEAVPTSDGLEIQVLDNEAPQYAHLEPYQYHGSVYGLVPALRGYLRPTGEWNDEEVTVNGTQVQVVLNGFSILEADLSAARVKPPDGKKHPGAFRTNGYFGFFGHGDPVAFRNIRIKRLP
jgi:hypothetical protein